MLLPVPFPSRQRPRSFVAIFCTATVLAWGLGLWLEPPGRTTRAVIHEFFYLTGTLAWGLMAIAITIAARPAWLERVTGIPLDRLYGTHKTLGLWTVGLSVLHWLGKSVGIGLTTLFNTLGAELARGSRPALPDRSALEGFDYLWSVLRPIAIESSVWATVAVVIIGLLALVKLLPYPVWLKAHRLFSILFLILTLHSVRLMEASDWLTPFGWINLAVTAIGAYYSLRTLLSGPGSEKTVEAEVRTVETHGDVTTLTVSTARPLQGRPGQFAFLGLPGHEPHPFTISGSSDGTTLRFDIKALGDLTRETIPNLKPGTQIRVEGPWGNFLYDPTEEEEAVWVAAGIGIAPFAAWMETLSSERPHPNVRLLWCVKDWKSEPLRERITRLAERTGIRLEVYESQGKRLEVEALFDECVPKRLAVCAGKELADRVERAYRKTGGDPKNVLRERFDWR